MTSGRINTVRDALNAASLIFNCVENPQKEAVLLMAHVLKTDIAYVYSKMDESIKENQYKDFIEKCLERNSGTPFQYITGDSEFMSLNFKVNKNVLIPRPETEFLVDQGLVFLKTRKHLGKQRVLDLCTGSGCVAVSIAKNFENCEIVAVDVSEEALVIAKENSELNLVQDRIAFVKSDLFSELTGKFDLIVCNPPYIKSEEIDDLQAEVQMEPRIALDGGADGYDFYRRIAEKAFDFLLDDGGIILELGIGQDEIVQSIFKNQRFYNKNFFLIRDYAKIIRTLTIY